MPFETLLLILILAVAVGILALCLWINRQLNRAGGAGLTGLFRQEFRESRSEAAEAAQRLREEVGKAQKEGGEATLKGIKELAASNEARLDRMRETVNRQLKELRESNEKELDRMRATVDEKLQSTLEKRLGASFKLVSERLEAVQRGLGDMQNLATGVGDLKRVLTNVSTRGTWGEYQLGDILEQILTPEQYDRNVKVKKRSSEVVEYAVKLPGKEDEADVWLPIDAKFPLESYQRLIDAVEAADADGENEAAKELQRSIRSSAKDISDKYLNPPHTTDFAILFLPTEGLYAEVLRRPGLVNELQQKHRVMLAGPTTLAALLNSLRMGFRTLAIQKRSSEVWQVLAAVKTEFGKFGGVLEKVQTHLSRASKTIKDTEVRTRVMKNRLKDVEKLPDEEATDLLGLTEPPAPIQDDEKDD